MAINEDFGALLREYTPHQMLENEIIKLNWFLKKVKKDPNWSLGAYKLPTEESENSSFEFGALVADADIKGATYDVPEITSPKSLFGALKFNNLDLERHDDLKKSFLSILPGKVKKFSARMEEMASMSLLGDGSICTVTADASAGGLVSVNRPWVLTGGMRVKLVDDNNSITGFVKLGSININAKTFVLADAPAGTAIDCSTIDLAQNPKVYLVGGDTGGFTSIIDIVFPASLGGADTLYGGAITKLDSPIYQPFAKDLTGSTTRSQLKDALFNFYYEAEQMGRNENRELLVPYSVFQALALTTESQRRLTEDSVKNAVGAKSMKLQGPDGDMVVTAIRDMVDGYCVVMDWDAVVFASRGELIKKANKMGGEFYEQRATTGYTYIKDLKLEGELIATNLSKLAGAKVNTTFAS